MEVKKIELRNINCGHVKKIEKIFEEYDISYVRKNFAKNTNLLGELTVIFEIPGRIREKILLMIQSTMKNIIHELVDEQHIKINNEYIKSFAQVKVAFNQ